MTRSPACRPTAATASPAFGIATMCAGVFCLTVNDAIAKWLGQFYPVAEVAFFRMLFALPMITVIGILVSGRRALRTARPLAHLGRGLLATLATFSFFYGLTLLPLAETTAIAFSAPLFVSLLALPLLGERLAGGDWAAVVIGFVGVLLVVQPGTAAFQFGALAPLVAAVSYALLMLTARMLGHGESIWATMFYATLVPLLVSAALLPWFWETPAWRHLPVLFALGAFGGAAMSLITQAFRIGPAAVVAPFDYTGLLWAVAFGWLFWRELPGPWAAAGALLIALCGVYLAWRNVGGGRGRGRPVPLPPPRGD